MANTGTCRSASGRMNNPTQLLQDTSEAVTVSVARYQFELPVGTGRFGSFCIFVTRKLTKLKIVRDNIIKSYNTTQ